MVLQIGKTKIFLRAGQMAELDACRTEILGKSAKIIQLQTRTRIARRRFVSMRKASIRVQAFWRGKSIDRKQLFYFEMSEHRVTLICTFSWNMFTGYICL